MSKTEIFRTYTATERLKINLVCSLAAMLFAYMTVADGKKERQKINVNEQRCNSIFPRIIVCIKDQHTLFPRHFISIPFFLVPLVVCLHTEKKTVFLSFVLKTIFKNVELNIAVNFFQC